MNKTIEKPKPEQVVPFEDVHFRRAGGKPSVAVLEKPTPMNDANYRHSHQLPNPEETLSFEHLAENYDITDEIRLTPKSSSSGPEGTVYYDSDDDHLWVATE